MEKSLKKLKKRGGFTLAETLAAVLILLMVSGVVAEGIPAAANVYRGTIDAANAQVVLSTTINALRDELTTARGLTVFENEVTYISADTGARTKISVSDQGVITVQDYLDYTGEETEGLTHSLISEAGVTQNLQVSYETVSRDGDVVCFKGLKVKNIKTDAEVAILNNLRIRVPGTGLAISGNSQDGGA